LLIVIGVAALWIAVASPVAHFDYHSLTAPMVLAADTMIASYAALINRARQQLAWLLDQLSKKEPATVS
jgi:ribosome-binding protein aMBF1 (putative translation factor)